LNVLVVSGSSPALDLLCPLLDKQPDVSCTRFDSRRLSIECSAEQHLIVEQFDSPHISSNVVCVGMRYGDLERCNLWEFVEQQSRIGDFCVVHVQSNPLLLALDELQITDVSRLEPELLDKLEWYVRQCERAALKLNSAARDRAVLSYSELLLDYRRTCRRILTYLGQTYAPDFPPAPDSGTLNLRRLLQLQTVLQVQGGLLAPYRYLLTHTAT